MDLFEDLTRPAIEFSAPTNNSATNDAQPELRLVFVDAGSGIDDETLVLTLNGAPLSADCTIDALGAECTPTSPLSDGAKTVTATISDTAENESDPATVQFTVDTVAPVITISSPTTGTFTNQENIVVMGGLSEAATLRINGTLVGLDGTNNFSSTVGLDEGANPIAVVATDNATNSTTRNLSITLDTQAPNIPNVGFIGVSNPSVEGIVTITGQAGSVEANALVMVTNVRTGQSVTVSATADGAFSAQIAGEEADQLQIRAIDNAQNQSQPGQTTVPGALPPNPATVATPLSSTGIVPFGESTAFLYTGATPIQTGVAPGTIQAEFAAVVRGSVTTRTGVPLPNVVITIKDQAQYGQTRTRADGRFDLAVNGGGTVFVDYQRQGYLPIHRVIEVRQNAYALAPNVVMIPVDSAVTEIALNTMTLQSHQSSIATDFDGERRVTLMVPPSTTATMTLANGSQQALGTSMRVRATEYTVGTNGVEAMPGVLPATSAYTYAVDLSVDEAIAAGATRVDFNQPLPVYVENFLGFEVGAEVPIGYYDRGPGSWIPSENGRIVEILSITGGLANLDIDGSEEPADTQELAALGITAAERQRLASLYDVGDTFWRFRASHFTPWDCNWPYDLDSDAVPPPELPSLDDVAEGDETPQCAGCIILAHNQTLGESIPIAGTQYSLNYRSDRLKSVHSIEFPVTGATVPPSLDVVMVRVEVAGREIYNTAIGAEYSPSRLPPQPNQTVTANWDGRDAYGRLVSGSIQGIATIRYGYVPRYSEASGLLAFGLASRTGTSVRSQPGGSAGNGLIPRLIFVERKQPFVAQARSPAVAQLGGWTLSTHHALDAQDPNLQKAMLHLGDGTSRAIAGGAQSIRAFPLSTSAAGTIRGVKVLFTGLALEARSTGVVRAQNGAVLAGGGSTPPAAGIVATAAQLPSVADVDATSVFGNTTIYFVAGNQAWAVTNGVLAHVAGTGAPGSTGDGGQATSAQLSSPSSIVYSASTGVVYIAEAGGHRVRRIAPDRTISTYAGNGTAGFSGDGGFATGAQLNTPRGLALAVDGSLFIADEGNNRVRRVDPTGRIRSIAGNGSACANPESLCGDGGPATSATLSAPRDVALYLDDEVAIADSGNRKIRIVRSNGVIVTAAGNGTTWTSVPSGDDGPPTVAPLSDELVIAQGSRGDLAIGDRDRIRLLSTSTPLQSSSATLVPSEDGSVVHAFDPAGRHLESRDSTGGALLQQFSYDSAGRLISIMDRAGNTTTIERGAGGAPIAIISADGQRTELARDANGWLSSVENPNGETIQLEHQPGGLLNAYTDARGNASSFTYDDAGRLILDEGPDDAGWQLSRAVTAEGVTVSMTSAEGLLSQFISSRTDGRDKSIISRFPDGTESSLTVFADREEEVLPEGTRVTRTLRPDSRFGMTAPVAGSSTRLPSGLTRSTTVDRVASLSDSLDPLSVVTATETHSLNGRAWISTYTASNRRLSTSSPEGRQNLVTFDLAGRVAETSSGGLLPLQMTYNPSGRVTEIDRGSGADLRRTVISYFATGPSTGLPQTITDAEGRQTTFQYDAAGRVLAQTLPGNRQVGFSYDANGNLTSVTPPGRTPHVFDYSALNLPTTYTPPANGLPLYATTHVYNRDRQLTSVTRPDGQQMVIAYGSGKVATMTTSRGVTGFTYAAATGQLSGISTPEGQGLTFAFDGPLPTETTWSGLVNGSVEQTYNQDFSISSINVNGSGISLGYDDDGMMTSAGALSISRVPDTGQESSTGLINTGTTSDYSEFGELRRYTATKPTSSAAELLEEIRTNIAEMRTDLEVFWTLKPSNNGRTAFNNLEAAALAQPVNSSTLSQQFNDFRIFSYPSIRTSALNRNSCECSDEDHAQILAAIARTDVTIVELEDLTNAYFSGGQGTQTVFRTDLTRDRLGRIVAKTESVEGVETDYEYDYDTAGRLTEVTADGSVVESYTYDANGNRLTANGVSYVHDAQDRMLSAGNVSFTYTANGDLQTRVEAGQTTTFAYDILGNLLSAQLPDGRSITYIVDGQNRRVGRRINGTLTQTFVYQDQLRVAAELDGVGAVVSRFVYGAGATTPAYMVRGGATYRIVSDPLGSPRLVINASSGLVVQRLNYDAYGSVIFDSNPGFQPFGFAGGIFDRDTGLVRFGARDYDSRTGRWTVKDRIGFAAGDTNLYGYVLADPVNLVDPSGYIIGRVLAGIVRQFTGQSAQEAALGGMVFDAIVGPAIGQMLPGTQGLSIQVQRLIAGYQLYGGASGILLSLNLTTGFYGAGALWGALTSSGAIPLVIAILSGYAVGDALYQLYYLLTGDTFGGDIHDLVMWFNCRRGG